MKKKLIKKVSSKKAYTLVELIVTVMILSITAGLGVGIFSSAMSNYSQAAITANEQEKALDIEDFIVRYARVANQIYFITNDPNKCSKAEYENHIISTDAAVKAKFPTATGGIITHNVPGDIINEDHNRVNYYDIYDEVKNKGTSAESRVYHEGVSLNTDRVKSIKFKLKRQKVDVDGLKDKFAYLYYEINMADGYSVKGNVMLYNCKNVTFVKDGNYTEKTADGTFTVCDDTYSTGIAFLKV